MDAPAVCRIGITQPAVRGSQHGLENFVPFNRDPPFLLPPDLQEWLPMDEVAHLVVAALERVPLGAFHVPAHAGGKPPYYPRLMLALLS